MSNYSGPFWIFVGSSGMPTHVKKCTFKPTVHPTKGEWIEVHVVNNKSENEGMRAAIGHMRSILKQVVDGPTMFVCTSHEGKCHCLICQAEHALSTTSGFEEEKE